MLQSLQRCIFYDYGETLLTGNSFLHVCFADSHSKYYFTGSNSRHFVITFRGYVNHAVDYRTDPARI